MRISDWSSDVCSSDLARSVGGLAPGRSGSRAAASFAAALAWRCDISSDSPRSRASGAFASLSRRCWRVPPPTAETAGPVAVAWDQPTGPPRFRSEEHKSELQSLMRTLVAVFCLTQNTHTIARYTYTEDKS